MARGARLDCVLVGPRSAVRPTVVVVVTHTSLHQLATDGLASRKDSVELSSFLLLL